MQKKNFKNSKEQRRGRRVKNQVGQSGELHRPEIAFIDGSPAVSVSMVV